MPANSILFISICWVNLMTSTAEKPFQFMELHMTEEYQRYMIEALKILSKDENYTTASHEILENTRDFNKVAPALIAAHPDVRSELDELKRVELERLRHAATREYEIKNNLTEIDHLDHTNPHSFEINDFEKLLKKLRADDEKLEKDRAEKFKRFEMEKKLQEELKLNELQGVELEKFKWNIEQRRKRKLRRGAIRHPGSRQQLEYVWKYKDRMDTIFEPKTFFFMHDLDGNMVLDKNELKILYLGQLSEAFDKTEAIEKEMELDRMIKQSLLEVDRNKNDLVEYDEYLKEMITHETEEDWKVLAEEDIFTKEEYEAYKKERLNKTTTEKPKV